MRWISLGYSQREDNNGSALDKVSGRSSFQNEMACEVRTGQSKLVVAAEKSPERTRINQAGINSADFTLTALGPPPHVLHETPPTDHKSTPPPPPGMHVLSPTTSSGDKGQGPTSAQRGQAHHSLSRRVHKRAFAAGPSIRNQGTHAAQDSPLLPSEG